ncbi:hypothetical protein PUN4_1220016 [Paraburkholderia unamae]|nr:hypothetical protein PUN4_1220016 [Paraburkholderia unamae]
MDEESPVRDRTISEAIAAVVREPMYEALPIFLCARQERADTRCRLALANRGSDMASHDAAKCLIWSIGGSIGSHARCSLRPGRETTGRPAVWRLLHRWEN